MATIGTLAVNVVADTQQFSNGMAKAAGITQQFDRQVSGAGGGLGKLVAGLGLAAAAVKVATAGVAQFTERFQAMDALADRAEQIGESFNNMLALDLIAQRAGLEDISGSLQKLTTNIGNARAGSTAAQATFERLGLSYNELAEQTPLEQLMSVADSLSLVKNRSDRAAAAVALFGREGRNMVGILEQGAGGLQDVADRALELHGAVSGEDLLKVTRANDAIHDMKLAWEGLWDAFIVAASPAIELVARLLERLFVTMRKFGEATGLFSDSTLAKMQEAAEGFGRIAEGGWGLGAGGPSKELEEVSRKLQDLAQRAQALRGDIASPMEVLRDRAAEAQELLRNGLVTMDQYSEYLNKLVQDHTEAEERMQKSSQRQVDVGAAVRGTAGGFSAVQQGNKQADQLRKDAAEAKRQREKMIELLGEISDDPQTNQIEIAEVRF